MPTTQPSINGSLNVFLELKGWDALARKAKAALEDRGAIAEPWREAMGDAAKLLEAYALRGAPVFQGRTAALMYHTMDRKPMPRWFKVATRAKRGTFAYPRFTNYSPYAAPRSPVRFQVGGNWRTGSRNPRPNPHRFWFDKALVAAWTHVPQILEQAARKMEQMWAS